MLPAPRLLRIRIKNDRHIVTVHYSVDGRTWTKFSNQFEVSGYHHNVAGDFLSLRPAVYAAGTGEVRIRDVRHVCNLSARVIPERRRPAELAQLYIPVGAGNHPYHLRAGYADGCARAEVPVRLVVER